MKYIPTFLCLLIGLTVWCMRRPPVPMTVISGPTMGTTFSVKIARPPKGDVSGEIHDILNRIDREMSTYRADSELSRFNEHRGNDWYEVSDDTARVIAEAIEVSQLTDGAFDVTVAPLVNLWGFGPPISRPAGVGGLHGGVAQIPADEAIAAAKETIGHQFLEARLNPPALRKARPTITVDVNGIAPGYAVDLIAARLDARGCNDYLIDVGGELRARGRSHLDRPWRVGIESPLDHERRVGRTLELKDRALSTSGDYRAYFEAGGRRYSHTIDPATGRPVTHQLASVSVVTTTTARADALATALMVLGPEKGFAFAQRQRLAAFFITRTDRGLEEKLTDGFGLLVCDR